jgi:hypothetical protein
VVYTINKHTDFECIPSWCQSDCIDEMAHAWYFGAPKRKGGPEPTVEDALSALREDDFETLETMLRKQNSAFRDAFESTLKNDPILFLTYATKSKAQFTDWKRFVTKVFHSNPTVVASLKQAFLQKFGASYDAIANTQRAGYVIPPYAGTPTLEDAGVETIKVIDESDIANEKAEFIRTEQQFPEFASGAKPYVLGGFAAYANPSSFHNAFVKRLRRQALDAVQRDTLFRRFVDRFDSMNADSYKVELYFDRMLHRYPQQSPTSETAHRDVTPQEFVRQGDVVFGGWINFTEMPQSFVAWPRSHLNAASEVFTTFDVASGSDGFKTINPWTPEYMQFQLHKQVFSVPPGHMIVFPQHILHEVLSNTAVTEQFRLFTGWRITKSNEIVNAAEKENIVNQLKTPPLPSNQVPVVFGDNHRSIFMKKQFNWTGDDAGPRGSVEEWWNASMNSEVKLAHSKVSQALNPLTTYFNDPAVLGLYQYAPADKNLMLTLHSLA